MELSVIKQFCRSTPRQCAEAGSGRGAKSSDIAILYWRGGAGGLGRKPASFLNGRKDTDAF